MYRFLFLLVVPLSILPAQLTKLRVTTPDSILARLEHRGFVKGRALVEGTYIPLRGATVVLSEQPIDSSYDANEIALKTKSDSGGVFFFDLVPEGQYYLEVDYPGYFPFSRTIWIDNQEVSTALIELIPDYSHPSLHKTGSAEFEVTDQSTGEPVGDASIHLAELHEIIDTDPSGVRYVHLLPPATYHFSVSADGYRERANDSVLVRSGTSVSVAVEIRESEVGAQDLLCRQNHHKPYPVSPLDPSDYCALRGTIADGETYERIPYETVYLAPYGLLAETDSTGTFVFRGLRPGTYCATVRSDGYLRTTVHEIDLLPGSARSITIFLRPAPLTDLHEQNP